MPTAHNPLSGTPWRRLVSTLATVLAAGMVTMGATASGASPGSSPTTAPAPNCARSTVPSWATSASHPGDGVPDPAGRIVFGPQTRMDKIFGEVIALYAIDPDGSDLVRLLDCEVMRPRFSRDGTRLAFGIAMDDGSIQVATMAVDGTDLRILTSTAGYAEQPDWSPDGSWIIYAHAPMHCPDPDCAIPGGYHESLWRMDADGSDQRPIDGPSRLDDVAGLPTISQDIEPRFSPDGTEVVFSRADGPDYQYTPMIRDLATGAERAATGNLRGEMHPDWSPDGEWIIYNTSHPADGTGPFGQIERVPSDDPTAEPVVLYPAAGSSRIGFKPAYSPDGSTIAFSCEVRLCTMDADGSNVQVLVTVQYGDGFLNHAAWGVIPQAAD